MNLPLKSVLPLAAKYRPSTFEQIIGQDEAVRVLSSLVSNETPPAVLLHGLPGTGKTSLAQIYGLARSCAAPTPSPCGRCARCVEGLTPFDWYKFSAAVWDDPETAKHAEVLMRQVPFGRIGVFVDEVHCMEPRSADVLLEEVERPRKGRFFICATTDLDQVRPALRSRCIVLGLRPIAPSKLFGLAQSICRKESIPYQPEALDILVDQAKGSARELIMALDSVATRGQLTPELLKSALSLEWTEELIAYFDALMVGDLGAQLQAAKAWLAFPGDKARRIKEFLLYLYNFEVCTPRIRDAVNAAFHLVGAPIRQRIVAGFAARAKRDRLSIDTYWSNLLSFWLIDAATVADEAALAIKLHQFHRLVTPVECLLLPEIEFPAGPKRVRRFRSRSQRDPAEKQCRTDEASTFLDFKDIERLAEAASLLGQHHGVWVNGFIELKVAAAEQHLDAAAREAITSLTHELGLQVKDRTNGKAGRGLHWIYRNRRSAGAIHCQLAVHVPYEHLDAAERWLASKEWKCSVGEATTLSANFHNPKPPNPKAREISRRNFHWQCMRALWAAVDPAILHWPPNGARKPLRHLLRLKGSAEASEPMTIKTIGVSHSLGPKVRAQAERNRMGFLSAFKDAAWDAIYSGWEMLEYRDREAEIIERADQVARLELIGAGENELGRKRYREELKNLEAQWPANPRLRPRTWPGWWAHRD